MKKLCSILLVTLIIFSSITCMFIGVHAESSDNIAVNYTTASGNVTWDSGLTGTSFIDSKDARISYNGNYSWRFNMNGTAADKNGDGKNEVYPCNVYIKLTNLKADTLYKFSYIYAESYRMDFVNIINPNSGEATVSGPTTERLASKTESGTFLRDPKKITVSFKADIDGDYTVTLASAKAYSNDNNLFSGVVLTELELYEISNTENLMQNLTYNNWKSATTDNRAVPKQTGESYSGDSYNAVAAYRLQWRTMYTEVELEAGKLYDFSFYYKEQDSNKVFLQTDGVGYLIAHKDDIRYSSSNERLITNNEDNLVYGSQFGVKSDKDGWCKMENTLAPAVSGTYYICFSANAKDSAGTKAAYQESLIYFSDFNLSEKKSDDLLEYKTYVEWLPSTNDNRAVSAKTNESYSGNSYNAFSVYRLQWRSVYTTVELEANKVYDFCFYYKEQDSSRVYLAKNRNGFVVAKDTDIAYTNSAKEVIKVNDDSKNLAKDGYLKFGTASDKAGWNVVKLTLSPTESGIYYISFSANANDTPDKKAAYQESLIIFSDLSLKEQSSEPNEPDEPDEPDEPIIPEDPTNLLSGLTIGDLISGCNTACGPEAKELPEGAIARFHMNRNSFYMELTLKAKTEYDFSFDYMGSMPVSAIRLVENNGDMVLTGTVGSGGPLTSKTSYVLNSVLPVNSATGWVTPTAKIKTGDATKYYLIIDSNWKASGTANWMYVKNFILREKVVVVEPEPSPEENADIDIFKDKTYNDWAIVSRGSIVEPKATYRKTATDGLTVEMMRYRSIFTKVSLKEGKTYNLTFYYSGDDLSLTDLESNYWGVQVISNKGIKNNGETITPAEGYKDLISNFVISDSEKKGWKKVTARFRAEQTDDYILVITAKGTADVDMHLSDFNLYEYVRPLDKDDVIKYHDFNDWSITNRGSILPPTESYKENDTTAFTVTKMRWRSIYTQIELEAGVTYKLSFKYKDSEDTYISRVLISDDNFVAPTSDGFQLRTLYGDPDYGDSVTFSGQTDKADWKLATALFTPTKGGTHCFAISASGESDATDVHLADFSIIKYYDPARDVMGTVSNAMGGTVTEKGTYPYKKNSSLTVKATALEGNTFDGWYNLNGQLVSSLQEYTFTVTEPFEITARFKGYNMPFVDWFKENNMDGTFENGTMVGWYADDPYLGEDSSWCSFNTSTYLAHNGKKSLAVNSRYRDAHFYFDNLEKNSDYHLSFYINCPDTDGNFLIHKFIISDSAGNAIWNRINNFGEGGSGWHRVDLFFNTGMSNSINILLKYNNIEKTEDQFVYFDDFSLVQYSAGELLDGGFEGGKKAWMGEYSITAENENNVAEVKNGKKLYQSLKLDEHSLYTVKFRAKGKAVMAATKINNYSTAPSNWISSKTFANTDGDWNDYSFDLFTGKHKAANLIFEALSDNAMVDEITITKHSESYGGIIEHIDFETDRFEIKHSNKNVYEIYSGSAQDENVHSGTKSLLFKYDEADKATEYIFEESYLDISISNKKVYSIVFHYKTDKGNSLKLSPDFHGDFAGPIGITHTAENNGWNRVEFYATSSWLYYLKPVISNILKDTNDDFYIDDIFYTVAPSVVTEVGVSELYSEAPLGVLYNEGFEEPVTKKNWGPLSKGMSVVKGDTEYGEKYLNTQKGSFYVLPVPVEAGVQYYFTASLRGTGGYIGLSTSADGKGLFNDYFGNIASFIKPTSKKWTRTGFKFAAPESGEIYLVVSADSGYIDIDNVLLFKEDYALETDVNDYSITKPFDYDATSGEIYFANGGYDEYGNPSTGDNIAAVTIVLISFLAAASVLLLAKKNKKEAE